MQPNTLEDSPKSVSCSLMLSVLPYVLAGVVLSALPLLALAQCPSADVPPACEYINDSPIQNGLLPPPPMGRPMPPPFLAQLDLTEAQQDTVFKLMHDKAPVIFDNEKIARKTMQELRQLTKSNRFDTALAKSLAEAHGKALAELAYLNTVMQAQVWALLSEVQRKQVAKQHAHPHEK